MILDAEFGDSPTAAISSTALRKRIHYVVVVSDDEPQEDVPAMLEAVMVFTLFPYTYDSPVGFQPIFSVIHYAYPFLNSHTTYVDDTYYSGEKRLPVTLASLLSTLNPDDVLLHSTFFYLPSCSFSFLTWSMCSCSCINSRPFAPLYFS
jgi:hypothetical protein